MNKLGMQGVVGLSLLIACLSALVLVPLTSPNPEPSTPNKRQLLTSSTRLLDKALMPKDYEVYYLDTYTGEGECSISHRCTINVSINKLEKPAILVFTAYEPIDWHITKHPDTIIKKIIVSGYNEQTVSGIPNHIPVESTFYTATDLDSRGNKGYFYGGYIQDSRQYRRMARKIEQLTGQKPKSVQAAYTTGSFLIDETKTGFQSAYNPMTDPLSSPTQTRLSESEQNSRNVKNGTDFGPYMAEVQRQIRRNWTPPIDSRNKSVGVLFKVSRDGRLQNAYIKQSSGSPEADRAALKAIRSSAPFRPLPSSFNEESVDIDFVFDYNVMKPHQNSPMKKNISQFLPQGCKLVSKSNALSDPAINILYKRFKEVPFPNVQGKEKTVMSVAYFFQKVRKAGDTSPTPKTVRHYTQKPTSNGPTLIFLKIENPNYYLAQVFGINQSSGNETLDEAAYQAVQTVKTLSNYPKSREGECFNIPFPLE